MGLRDARASAARRQYVDSIARPDACPVRVSDAGERMRELRELRAAGSGLWSPALAAELAELERAFHAPTVFYPPTVD